MSNSELRSGVGSPVLPPGAIDNHCHVLDPDSFYLPDARYAPFDAPLAAYVQHLHSLGASRGVLVTASTHGTNNRPMLEALRNSTHKLRGIAVVDEAVSDPELIAMHDVGVRGLRLQDQFPGGASLHSLVALGRRIAPLGWHLELWTDFALHMDWLPAAIERCRVPVVLDHMGYFPMEHEKQVAATASMINLAREGHTWITLSGSYRLAPKMTPMAASQHVAPRVNQMLNQVPERLLWGSDWPHVAPPNDSPSVDNVLSEVEIWFSHDPALVEQVTVANNAACYDY